jgi:ribosomal protein S12 methylthiotransferase
MKKVSIITLGCAKNTSDTENLSGLLKKKGYGVVDNPEEADTIVVHTCSFIEAAKKESIQAVLEAAKFKNERKQLIVSGCMVQQHGKEMLEELPEVDAFLGTGQLTQIPDLIEKPRSRFLDRRDPGGLVNATWLADPDSQPDLPSKGAMAYLRLSEGCSHPCSFCVIPKLRGGLQSRPEAIVLREARALAQKGVEELVLIGQDTGEWGKDIYGDKKLHVLLDKLGHIDGVRWIRLMYMHPYSMTNDVLNVMAADPDKPRNLAKSVTVE